MKRPNILLISFDQWRADAMSLLEHPVVRTPNIDALANDATVFKRHYTVSTPCGPARASLFTGLYAHNHRSVRNGVPLDARHTNLAQVLARCGYRPKLFGFTDTTLDPRPLPPDHPGRSTMASALPGFENGCIMSGDCEAWVDWLVARGYPRPATSRGLWQPARERTRVDAQATRYSAQESESWFLTDQVLAQLGSSTEAPWCFHVSYFRPHHPYIAPAQYLQHYVWSAMPAPIGQRTNDSNVHPWLAQQLARVQAGNVLVQDVLPMSDIDEQAILQLRANYFASVEECDAMVGRLIAALKEQGVYDDTLIILTSDHGDLLGDHGLWAAESYFEQAAHIPLLIKLPGGRAQGRQIDAFTESIDIFPTLIELLGAPMPDALDGHSLCPWLSQVGAPADWRKHAHWEYDFRDVLSVGAQAALQLPDESCNLSVIRGERYKYVHFAALDSLLFDLVRDPSESHPCPNDATHDAIRLELLGAMMSWRMRHDDTSLVQQHIARRSSA